MMPLCRELQREVKESKEKKRKKRRRSDSSEGEGGGSGTSEDEGDLEENCEQLSQMFHGYCVSLYDHQNTHAVECQWKTRAFPFCSVLGGNRNIGSRNPPKS